MLTKKIMRKKENEKQEKISSGRLLLRGIYMHFSDLKIRHTKLVIKTLGNRIRNSLWSSILISWAKRLLNKTRQCGSRSRTPMRLFQIRSSANVMILPSHLMRAFHKRGIGLMRKHFTRFSLQFSIVTACGQRKSPYRTLVTTALLLQKLRSSTSTGITSILGVSFLSMMSTTWMKRKIGTNVVIWITKTRNWERSTKRRSALVWLNLQKWRTIMIHA